MIFFSISINCHDSFRTYLICFPLNIHERIGYRTRKVLTGKLNRFHGILYGFNSFILGWGVGHDVMLKSCTSSLKILVFFSACLLIQSFLLMIINQGSSELNLYNYKFTLILKFPLFRSSG